MGILPVNPVVMDPVSIARNPEQGVKNSPSFGEMLNNALSEVNQSQVKADRIEIQFLTGEVTDLHQVVIAMEEARLMMSLAIEVRNRVVETYQEVSRMQI